MGCLLSGAGAPVGAAGDVHAELLQDLHDDDRQRYAQPDDLIVVLLVAVGDGNLAEAAATIELGSYLLLGHGEEQGGGRKRDSIVSDAMESVIAASFMDGGFAAAKEIIDRLILSNIPKGRPRNFDYKTAFQELVQRKKDQQIHYELTGESGPDHDKHFEVEVLLNGKAVGHGVGSSKKRAEQAAAEAAIEALFPGEI